MKRRTPEAARLERDYLDRVRNSLGDVEPSEIEEIIRSLQEHVEQEVSSIPKGEVGLADMANVLERLGPPEDYSSENEENSSRAASRPAPESAARRASPLPPPPLELGLSSEARNRFADLLDKVWIAYLIGVVGLFVPVIELHVCAILGGIILAAVLLRFQKEPGPLRTAGILAGTEAILWIIICPLSILALMVPMFALLALPVVLAGPVCHLMAYWMIVGKTASVLNDAGCAAEAGRIHSARIRYVVAYLGLLGLGIVAAVVAVLAIGSSNAGELWWLGLVMLPFSWVVGWLFLLRPLGGARRALRA